MAIRPELCSGPRSSGGARRDLHVWSIDLPPFPAAFWRQPGAGLLFQTALWLVLATIFADIFFRAGFALRNLALFSFCFGLAAPLFWFNSLGTEYLMLAGALILIVIFHLRGSLTRYEIGRASC